MWFKWSGNVPGTMTQRQHENNLMGKYFYSPSLNRSYIENMLLVCIRKCYIMPYMAFIPFFCPWKQKKSWKPCFLIPTFYVCWQLKRLISWQLPQYVPLPPNPNILNSYSGKTNKETNKYSFLTQSCPWVTSESVYRLLHTGTPFSPGTSLLRCPIFGEPSFTSLPPYCPNRMQGDGVFYMHHPLSYLLIDMLVSSIRLQIIKELFFFFSLIQSLVL